MGTTRLSLFFRPPVTLSRTWMRPATKSTWSQPRAKASPGRSPASAPRAKPTPNRSSSARKTRRTSRRRAHRAGRRGVPRQGDRGPRDLAAERGLLRVHRVRDGEPAPDPPRRLWHRLRPVVVGLGDSLHDDVRAGCGAEVLRTGAVVHAGGPALALGAAAVVAALAPADAGLALRAGPPVGVPRAPAGACERRDDGQDDPHVGPPPPPLSGHGRVADEPGMYLGHGPGRPQLRRSAGTTWGRRTSMWARRGPERAGSVGFRRRRSSC